MNICHSFVLIRMRFECFDQTIHALQFSEPNNEQIFYTSAQIRINVILMFYLMITISVENSIDNLVNRPFSDPYQISPKFQLNQNRLNPIKYFRINKSNALTKQKLKFICFDFYELLHQIEV